MNIATDKKQKKIIIVINIFSHEHTSNNNFVVFDTRT